MNKFIVNKNKNKIKKERKERHPSLTPSAELGRHSLVVLEPRFKRLCNRVYDRKAFV